MWMMYVLAPFEYIFWFVLKLHFISKYYPYFPICAIKYEYFKLELIYFYFIADELPCFYFRCYMRSAHYYRLKILLAYQTGVQVKGCVLGHLNVKQRYSDGTWNNTCSVYLLTHLNQKYFISLTHYFPFKTILRIFDNWTNQQ